MNPWASAPLWNRTRLPWGVHVRAYRQLYCRSLAAAELERITNGFRLKLGIHGLNLILAVAW